MRNNLEKKNEQGKWNKTKKNKYFGKSTLNFPTSDLGSMLKS